MITIKTETNKENINKFLAHCGVSFDFDDCIVMAVKDNDVILALGALSLEDGHVFLDHIVVTDDCADDLNLVLGLMKSLLNLADLRGIKIVYGANPAMFDLYKMLGFQKCPDAVKKMYELSLEGYFTHEKEE